MSQLSLWFFTGFLVSLPVVACTNEEDLGGRPSTDAGTDGSPNSISGTDAGSGKTMDSSTADSGDDSFGKTRSGESCNPTTFPAAVTSCSIPGLYTVTESDCSANACGAPAEIEWTATVTVTGTEVKLTNGTNRLLKCQLSNNCDCLTSSGSLYFRFTNTGFIGTGTSSCGDAYPKWYFLTKGIKQ